LDLIEGKPVGILAIIDDFCLLPKPSDERLLSVMADKLKSSKLFSVLRESHKRGAESLPPLPFSINHFAGEVVYSMKNFVEKNRDELPKQSYSLLQSSTSFLRTLFSNVATPTKFQSVGMQFKEQLRGLMVKIHQTAPHYIRCLKPNDESRCDAFDRDRITQQLRYCGVLEVCRVSRSGFHVRYKHQDFLSRYLNLLTLEIFEYIQRKVMPADDKVRPDTPGPHLKILCSELIGRVLDADFAKEKVEIGNTKVFLRKKAHDLLEKMLSLRLRSTLSLQSLFRSYRIHQRYKLMKRSAIRIQSIMRCFLSKKLLIEMKRQQRILNLTKYHQCKRLQTWYRRLLAEKWRRTRKRELLRSNQCRRIQRWCRGILKEKRRIQLIKEFTERNNAIRLQVWYTFQRARQERDEEIKKLLRIWSLKYFAKKIMKWYRARMEQRNTCNLEALRLQLMKELLEENQTIRIQRWYRHLRDQRRIAEKLCQDEMKLMQQYDRDADEPVAVVEEPIVVEEPPVEVAPPPVIVPVVEETNNWFDQLQRHLAKSKQELLQASSLMSNAQIDSKAEASSAKEDHAYLQKKQIIMEKMLYDYEFYMDLLRRNDAREVPDRRDPNIFRKDADVQTDQEENQRAGSRSAYVGKDSEMMTMGESLIVKASESALSANIDSAAISSQTDEVVETVVVTLDFSIDDGMDMKSTAVVDESAVNEESAPSIQMELTATSAVIESIEVIETCQTDGMMNSEISSVESASATSSYQGNESLLIQKQPFSSVVEEEVTEIDSNPIESLPAAPQMNRRQSLSKIFNLYSVETATTAPASDIVAVEVETKTLTSVASSNSLNRRSSKLSLSREYSDSSADPSPVPGVTPTLFKLNSSRRLSMSGHDDSLRLKRGEFAALDFSPIKYFSSKLQKFYAVQSVCPRLVDDVSVAEMKLNEFAVSLHDNSPSMKEVMMDKIFSPLQPASPGDADVLEPKKVLLLGEAGIGKSTFLREIAHRWGNQEILKTFTFVFRIRWRLFFHPMWKHAYTAEELLDNAFFCFVHFSLSQEILEARLRPGTQYGASLALDKSEIYEVVRDLRDTTLYLFDDLDLASDYLQNEKSVGDQASMLRSLMLTAFQLPFILMTAQRVDNLSPSIRSNFDENLVLKGFNVSESERFVTKYFNNHNSKLSDRLKEGLSSHPLFFALAGNPLHLGIICLVLSYDTTLIDKLIESPHRAVIYREYFIWLCKRFVNETGESLSYADSDKVFEHPIFALMKELMKSLYQSDKLLFLTSVDIDKVVKNSAISLKQFLLFGFFDCCKISANAAGSNGDEHEDFFYSIQHSIFVDYLTAFFCYQDLHHPLYKSYSARMICQHRNLCQYTNFIEFFHFLVRKDVHHFEKFWTMITCNVDEYLEFDVQVKVEKFVEFYHEILWSMQFSSVLLPFIDLSIFLDLPRFERVIMQRLYQTPLIKESMKSILLYDMLWKVDSLILCLEDIREESIQAYARLKLEELAISANHSPSVKQSALEYLSSHGHKITSKMSPSNAPLIVRQERIDLMSCLRILSSYMEFDILSSDEVVEDVVFIFRIPYWEVKCAGIPVILTLFSTTEFYIDYEKCVQYVDALRSFIFTSYRPQVFQIFEHLLSHVRTDEKKIVQNYIFSACTEVLQLLAQRSLGQFFSSGRSLFSSQSLVAMPHVTNECLFIPLYEQLRNLQFGPRAHGYLNLMEVLRVKLDFFSTEQLLQFLQYFLHATGKEELFIQHCILSICEVVYPQVAYHFNVRNTVLDTLRVLQSAGMNAVLQTQAELLLVKYAPSVDMIKQIMNLLESQDLNSRNIGLQSLRSIILDSEGPSQIFSQYQEQYFSGIASILSYQRGISYLKEFLPAANLHQFIELYHRASYVSHDIMVDIVEALCKEEAYLDELKEVIPLMFNPTHQLYFRQEKHQRRLKCNYFSLFKPTDAKNILFVDDFFQDVLQQYSVTNELSLLSPLFRNLCYRDIPYEEMSKLWIIIKTKLFPLSSSTIVYMEPLIAFTSVDNDAILTLLNLMKSSLLTYMETDLKATYSILRCFIDLSISSAFIGESVLRWILESFHSQRVWKMICDYFANLDSFPVEFENLLVSWLDSSSILCGIAVEVLSLNKNVSDERIMYLDSNMKSFSLDNIDELSISLFACAVKSAANISYLQPLDFVQENVDFVFKVLTDSFSHVSDSSQHIHVLQSGIIDALDVFGLKNPEMIPKLIAKLSDSCAGQMNKLANQQTRQRFVEVLATLYHAQAELIPPDIVALLGTYLHSNHESIFKLFHLLSSKKAKLIPENVLSIFLDELYLMPLTIQALSCQILHNLALSHHSFGVASIIEAIEKLFTSGQVLESFYNKNLIDIFSSFVREFPELMTRPLLSKLLDLLGTEGLDQALESSILDTLFGFVMNQHLLHVDLRFDFANDMNQKIQSMLKTIHQHEHALLSLATYHSDYYNTILDHVNKLLKKKSTDKLQSFYCRLLTKQSSLITDDEIEASLPFFLNDNDLVRQSVCLFASTLSNLAQDKQFSYINKVLDSLERSWQSKETEIIIENKRLLAKECFSDFVQRKSKDMEENRKMLLSIETEVAASAAASSSTSVDQVLTPRMAKSPSESVQANIFRADDSIELVAKLVTCLQFDSSSPEAEGNESESILNLAAEILNHIISSDSELISDSDLKNYIHSIASKIPPEVTPTSLDEEEASANPSAAFPVAPLTKLSKTSSMTSSMNIKLRLKAKADIDAMCTELGSSRVDIVKRAVKTLTEQPHLVDDYDISKNLENSLKASPEIRNLVLDIYIALCRIRSKSINTDIVNRLHVLLTVKNQRDDVKYKLLQVFSAIIVCKPDLCQMFLLETLCNLIADKYPHVRRMALKCIKVIVIYRKDLFQDMVTNQTRDRQKTQSSMMSPMSPDTSKSPKPAVINRRASTAKKLIDSFDEEFQHEYYLHFDSSHLKEYFAQLFSISTNDHTVQGDVALFLVKLLQTDYFLQHEDISLYLPQVVGVFLSCFGDKSITTDSKAKLVQSLQKLIGLFPRHFLYHDLLMTTMQEYSQLLSSKLDEKKGLHFIVEYILSLLDVDYAQSNEAFSYVNSELIDLLETHKMSEAMGLKVSSLLLSIAAKHADRFSSHQQWIGKLVAIDCNLATSSAIKKNTSKILFELLLTFSFPLLSLVSHPALGIRTFISEAIMQIVHHLHQHHWHCGYQINAASAYFIDKLQFEHIFYLTQHQHLLSDALKSSLDRLFNEMVKHLFCKQLQSIDLSKLSTSLEHYSSLSMKAAQLADMIVHQILLLQSWNENSLNFFKHYISVFKQASSISFQKSYLHSSLVVIIDGIKYPVSDHELWIEELIPRIVKTYPHKVLINQLVARKPVFKNPLTIVALASYDVDTADVRSIVPFPEALNISSDIGVFTILHYSDSLKSPPRHSLMLLEFSDVFGNQRIAKISCRLTSSSVTIIEKAVVSVHPLNLHTQRMNVFGAMEGIDAAPCYYGIAAVITIAQDRLIMTEIAANPSNVMKLLEQLSADIKAFALEWPSNDSAMTNIRVFEKSDLLLSSIDSSR
jgi:hypothetical protein